MKKCKEKVFEGQSEEVYARKSINAIFAVSRFRKTKDISGLSTIARLSFGKVVTIATLQQSECMEIKYVE